MKNPKMSCSVRKAQDQICPAAKQLTDCSAESSFDPTYVLPHPGLSLPILVVAGLEPLPWAPGVIWGFCSILAGGGLRKSLPLAVLCPKERQAKGLPKRSCPFSHPRRPFVTSQHLGAGLHGEKVWHPHPSVVLHVQTQQVNKENIWNSLWGLMQPKPFEWHFSKSQVPWPCLVGSSSLKTAWMQHCVFLQLDKESCFILTVTDFWMVVTSELTRMGKATVGMRNVMESPRVLWKFKSSTGEAILLLSEMVHAFTFWLESAFMKFLYIPLCDSSTAAVNVVVNKTKNRYLGRMQRGKFFTSTFMINPLNQDFTFLGLRGKRNGQFQDDNNMSRVLMVKGGMLCGYLPPFFFFLDRDLRKIWFWNWVRRKSHVYQLTPPFCMVLQSTFWMFPETEVLTTFAL